MAPATQAAHVAHTDGCARAPLPASSLGGCSARARTVRYESAAAPVHATPAACACRRAAEAASRADRRGRSSSSRAPFFGGCNQGAGWPRTAPPKATCCFSGRRQFSAHKASRAPFVTFQPAARCKCGCRTCRPFTLSCRVILSAGPSGRVRAPQHCCARAAPLGHSPRVIQQQRPECAGSLSRVARSSATLVVVVVVVVAWPESKSEPLRYTKRQMCARRRADRCKAHSRPLSGRAQARLQTRDQPIAVTQVLSGGRRSRSRSRCRCRSRKDKTLASWQDAPRWRRHLARLISRLSARSAGGAWSRALGRASRMSPGSWRHCCRRRRCCHLRAPQQAPLPSSCRVGAEPPHARAAMQIRLANWLRRRQRQKLRRRRSKPEAGSREVQ